MEILFLDLATNTGWARGNAGSIPKSGSVKLGKDGLGPGQLGLWLRDHVRLCGKPDLIGVEKWMPVNAQRSDKNIEVSLRLNGAVHAIAGVYTIRVAEIYASTMRAAVCGRASAAGDVYGVPKSMLKAAQRAATKAMVVKTAKLLNLMPADAKDDDDRADALIGFRYCEAIYGRRAPAEFILT